MSAIIRMRKITTGKHWWHLNDDNMYWMSTADHYRHLTRFYNRPFKKRKYYRRKKLFVEYESHRKKGVEYLPF